MDKVTDDLNKLVNMYPWSWDFIKHIEDYSENHKKWFNETYKGIWPIAETSIEILNATLEILLKHSNRANWKLYYWEQFILIINALPFLYWTYKSIVDGFYLQSSLNLRWAFEDLLRVYFINFNPTNFNKIFWKEAKRQIGDRQKKTKDYPDFIVTQFIENELIIPRWLKIYELLSYETHSNILSVASDMAKVEKWDFDIYADIQWKLDVRGNIELLFMIIYAFFRYIDNVLICNTSLNDSEDILKILETKTFLMSILGETLLEEHKNEVDSIMKIILENEAKN